MPVDVLIRPFNKELDFEKALAELLTQHGWEPAILVNPTEQELVNNWSAIIFNNNRDINRLGDYPLTDSEMQQIIAKVNQCRNPYEVSKFINGDGKTQVSIVRDNPRDLVNCGKEVYLKLFDPCEIRAGQSTYQIVRQPKFETRHPLAGNRRGDVMLLINGMPVIHIELKRSGVDVSQAVNQIKKYMHEGVFSQGIFSLVQIFVAMTPEKTLYFANPGEEEKFSSALQFHWADFNNNEEYDWKRITSNLLSIPMAHQMIGFYTIADDKDETLKVLRSYQYYAANKISDRVHKTNWDDHYHKGGFIWHTTGSGKTMTSFKSAQLISKSGDADKVVFLLDRVELSVQSLDEYRGFAGENDSVQDSDNTMDLISLLESDDKDDCLIVTSLQKMSRITRENNVPESTINRINNKRVVFIIDECHRGMYGSMLMSIKHTFPRAILFGFTGTPVFEDNAHGELTTEVIFGDMLHKYTLANGIPDGNVLGFDCYKVETFEERDIREKVAFNELGISSSDEIGDNQEMQEIYDYILNQEDILKIEDRAKSIYSSPTHYNAVVQKIVEERPRLSRNGMFHAILATKNIPEAITYYQLFKTHYPEYNVATIFDDSIDNNGEKAIFKEDAILEMLDDYNHRFGTDFQQSTYAKYKKDVAKRLAHKAPYQHVEKEKQLDLLIVVTQMLTGYDSKWVNTLYVDKLLKYVDVIQAFSRTNRLFGPEKPFGIIKYFACPNRMKKNIDDALELYVDQPLTVFTDKLEANLEKINREFATIRTLFEAEGIAYYATLPQAGASRKKFAKEFCQMTKHIEAAKMQGFYWDQADYEFEHTGNRWVKLHVELDEQTYTVLLQRYRELFQRGERGEGGDDDVYQLEAYITETGLGTIDAEYINSKFIRFVKNLYTSGPGSDQVMIAQKELHTAFASLSQHDQRTAVIILHDIQSGDLRLSPDKTIYDYINDYQRRECDRQIYTLGEATGLNIDKLRAIISRDTNEININDQGRLDELIETRDPNKVDEFLRRVYEKEFSRVARISRFKSAIRCFILDAADRANIIYAYQNEGVEWSEGAQIVEPQEQLQDAIPEHTESETILSREEQLANIRNEVLHDLRGLYNMPPIEEVVDGFFKVVNTSSLVHLDGIAIVMYDAFNELYAHRNVNFIKKHVCLNELMVGFEVFLKKVYYLLYDHEVEGTRENGGATLSNAIHAFDCLWGLRNNPNEKYQRLSGYLNQIRYSRNAESTHGTTFDSEEEMDRKIHAAVTMYMFVTGIHWRDLKYKYDL